MAIARLLAIARSAMSAAAVGSSATSALASPDQRRHQRLHVAPALGQLERLPEQGDALAALPAQQLHLTDL